MMLLEHDAKELLAARGVAVPRGVLVAGPDGAPPFDGPWFVKAQVPAGGRGKAGGIVAASTEADLDAALSRLIGSRLKGHLVRECRVEQKIEAAVEVYLSLSVDPRSGGVTVLLSPLGGVDIEEETERASIMSETCPRDPAAIARAAERLTDHLAEPARSAFREAGRQIAAVFVDLEALQIEINPVLVAPDGWWTAGDAKVILDENAFPRRPELADLVLRRKDAYPEAALKLAQEFDYVELDPDGRIGLVTTGAGLSMQLIDELLEQGVRPFNFCDIRSGTFRGDPGRLIWVMRRIAAGRSVGAVLVNIFAGVTHLGELARLLLQALDAVPELDVPIVVRLVGNGLEEAREVLKDGNRAVTLEVDLEKAVALAVAALGDAP